LAGITTIAAAVAPAETGSAFVAERSGRVRILCTQEERLVGNDNTVKWRVSSCRSRRAHSGRTLCASWCGARIPDGRPAMFHGPHRLADYDLAGDLCDGTKLAA
jgi:hypothetical protein